MAACSRPVLGERTLLQREEETATQGGTEGRVAACRRPVLGERTLLPREEETATRGGTKGGAAAYSRPVLGERTLLQDKGEHWPVIDMGYKRQCREAKRVG